MSKYVDIEYFFYRGFVVSLERFTWHYTCVVNQNGNSANFALDLLAKFSDFFQRRHVASGNPVANNIYNTRLYYKVFNNNNNHLFEETLITRMDEAI